MKKHYCHLPPSAPQAKRQVLPQGSVHHNPVMKGVPSPGDYHKSGTTRIDRNLIGVSPLSEQFEPTPMDPIPQHQRMNGVS